MKTTKKCDCCNGSGEITTDVCISEWTPPKHHENYDMLIAVVQDAVKAKSDYNKLCELNPRALPSYGLQLESTLAKLECEALELLK